MDQAFRRFRLLAALDLFALPLFVALFLLALHAWTGQFLGVDNLRGLASHTALVVFCATGAMLVLIGVTFISQGLLGEMMSRTYFESQGKTAYTVRTTLNLEPREKRRAA